MTSPPGQVAYEAYARAINLQKSLTWAMMPPRHRDAWEAAAQAVLTSQTQADAIVAQINAREAASLEALRSEAEEHAP